MRRTVDNLQVLLLVGFFLSIAPGAALGEGKSADELAKELSNPTTALASLHTHLEYRAFDGDLPWASDQDAWLLSFQPAMPFPQDNGNNLIVRPLIPVLLDQPYFDLDEVGFESKGPELGDIAGDLAYGGTSESGLMLMGGLFFSLPTATSNEIGSGQWRLGPEAAVALVRKWGLVGGLGFHQWDVEGWKDQATSLTSVQYFYAIGLGNGWQLASSPTISYDWQADDSSSAWTVPLGVGVAKTTLLGELPVKFQLQSYYYLEHPDPFGQEWGAKFTVSPVIKNPFIRDRGSN
jgi:hypothetical protein